MKSKVNYEAIYKYLSSTKEKKICANDIARAIGARVYGATMAKLVREGMLDKTDQDGYYYNFNHR